MRFDRLGTTALVPRSLSHKSQLLAVVGLITEEFLRRFGSADQPRCRWTIMRFAAGQKEGKNTAFSICDCVDFRIAPAARASNRLCLFPLFAPDAERCALMGVESIICVCVDRPPAAERVSLSKDGTLRNSLRFSIKWRQSGAIRKRAASPGPIMVR